MESFMDPPVYAVQVPGTADSNQLLFELGSGPTHVIVEIERWDSLNWAFRDCLRYVDVDNMTMQHKYRAWNGTLFDDRPFDPSNVKVSG